MFFEGNNAYNLDRRWNELVRIKLIENLDERFQRVKEFIAREEDLLRKHPEGPQNRSAPLDAANKMKESLAAHFAPPGTGRTVRS